MYELALYDIIGMNGSNECLIVRRLYLDIPIVSFDLERMMNNNVFMNDNNFNLQCDLTELNVIRFLEVDDRSFKLFI